MEALSKEKELEQFQRQFRKAETEAVVPHFAALRGSGPLQIQQAATPPPGLS